MNFCDLKTPKKKECSNCLLNKKYIKCSNCSKYISSNKKLLHDRFCKINMKKCIKCDEAIPIEEYKEHLKNHNKQKEKSSIKKKKTSSKKLIPCKYCGLFLNQLELNEHQYFCGCKTEECKFCGEYVIRKNLENHYKKICEFFNRNNSTEKSKIHNLTKSQNNCSSNKNKSSAIRNRMLSLDKEIERKAKLTKSRSRNKNNISKSKDKNKKNNDLFPEENISKNLLFFLNFDGNNKILKNKRKREIYSEDEEDYEE